MILDAPGGPVTFEADDFRLIVPGGDPAAEWPARLRRPARRASDGLLAAAWWALENGLTPEADRDPPRDPRRRPGARADRDPRSRPSTPSPPPCPTRIGSDFPPDLGRGFRTARSPHFLLLSRLDEAEAAGRLDLLERVYTSFFLTLRRPRHRPRPAPPSPDRRRLRRRRPNTSTSSPRGCRRLRRRPRAIYHPPAALVATIDPRDIALDPGLASRRREQAPLRDDWRGRPARPRPAGLLLDLERLGHRPRRRGPRDGPSARRRRRGLAPRHDAFPTLAPRGPRRPVRGRPRRPMGGRRPRQRPPPPRLALPPPPPRLAPLVRDEGFGHGLPHATSTPRPGPSSTSSARPAPPSSPASSTCSAPRPTPGDDLRALAALPNLLRRRPVRPWRPNGTASSGR